MKILILLMFFLAPVARADFFGGVTFPSGPEVFTTVSESTTTISGNLTVTGSSTTFSGNVGLNGYVQVFSQTKAQLSTLVPTATGQVYYCSDCTALRMCISTGTAAGSFASPTSATTACN